MKKATAIILIIIHFAHAFAGAHGAISVFSKYQNSVSDYAGLLGMTDVEKTPLSKDTDKECEHDYEITDTGTDEEIYHRCFLQIASDTTSEGASITYTPSHCKLIELPERELNTPPPESSQIS